MATYSPRPLTVNESASNSGMTHVSSVNANDLTNAVNNTATTLTLCTLKAGDVMVKVLWRAKTFFENTADAAFNTTTMSVGNTASGVAAHIAAIELNINGTEVRQGFVNTAVMYAAADSLTVTFNAMAAKNLNSLNKGEVEILFQILRPAVIEQAVGAKPITK